MAVAEPDDQLRSHRDPAASSHDHADQILAFPVHGHEINQRHGAIAGLEIGLKDERLAAIAPPRRGLAACGLDQPTAVVGRTKQRSEASL